MSKEPESQQDCPNGTLFIPYDPTDRQLSQICIGENTSPSLKGDCPSRRLYKVYDSDREALCLAPGDDAARKAHKPLPSTGACGPNEQTDVSRYYTSQGLAGADYCTCQEGFERDANDYCVKLDNFQWWNPGSWFSSISATGEQSEPVFIPQGQTPPAGTVQVAAPTPTPAPEPAPVDTPVVNEPPTQQQKTKTSPLVWVALAGAVALGGWFIYKNTGKKTK